MTRGGRAPLLARPAGLYGRWCVGYGHWAFAGGLLLAAAAAAGLARVPGALCWTSIWHARSDRLDADQQAYADLFTGDGRQLAVAVASASAVAPAGSPASTPPFRVGAPAALSAASRDGLEALFGLSAVAYTNVSVGAVAQNGSALTLRLEDLCERPPVPPTYRPPGVDANGTADWLSRRAYQSFAYGALTRCLAARDGLFAPNGTVGEFAEGNPLNLSAEAVPLEPLPPTWGIPVFPCVRHSALDCFAEGELLGYPTPLRELQRVAAAVDTARAACVNPPDPANCTYNACVFDDLLEVLAPLSSPDPTPTPTPAGGGGGGGLPPPMPPASSLNGPPGGVPTIDAVLAELNDVTVPRFAAWGYAWRPRFRVMTSDAIAEYLGRAVDFGREANVSAASCASQSDKPCCLSWDGTAADPSATMGAIRRGVLGSVTDVGAIRTVLSTRDGRDWVYMRGGAGGLLTPTAAAAYAGAIRNPIGAAVAAGDTSRLSRSSNDGLSAAARGLEAAFLAAVTPAFERASGSGFAEGEPYASLAARVYATRSEDDSFVLTASRVPSPLLLGVALGAMLPVVGVSLANCARPLGATNLVASRIGLGVAGVGVLGVGALATAGLARGIGAALTPLAFHLGPVAAVVVGAVDLFMLVLAVMATGGSGQSGGAATASARGSTAGSTGGNGGGGGDRGGRSGRSSRDSGDAAVAHITDAHRRLYMAAAAAVPPSLIAAAATAAAVGAAAAISRVPAVRAYGATVALSAAAGAATRLALLLPLAAADTRRVIAGRLDGAPWYRVPLDGGALGGEARCWRRSASTGRLVAVARDGLAGRVLLRASPRSTAASTAVVVAVLAASATTATIAAHRYRRGALPWSRLPAGSAAAAYRRLDTEQFGLAPAVLVTTAAPGASFVLPGRQRALLTTQVLLQAAANVSDLPLLRERSWYGPAAGSLLAYSAALDGPPPAGAAAQGVDPVVPADSFSERLVGWASTVGIAAALDVYCYDQADTEGVMAGGGVRVGDPDEDGDSDGGGVGSGGDDGDGGGSGLGGVADGAASSTGASVPGDVAGRVDAPPAAAPPPPGRAAASVCRVGRARLRLHRRRRRQRRRRPSPGRSPPPAVGPDPAIDPPAARLLRINGARVRFAFWNLSTPDEGAAAAASARSAVDAAQVNGNAAFLTGRLFADVEEPARIGHDAAATIAAAAGAIAVVVGAGTLSARLTVSVVLAAAAAVAQAFAVGVAAGRPVCALTLIHLALTAGLTTTVSLHVAYAYMIAPGGGGGGGGDTASVHSGASVHSSVAAAVSRGGGGGGGGGGSGGGGRAAKRVRLTSGRSSTSSIPPGGLPLPAATTSPFRVPAAALSAVLGGDASRVWFGPARRCRAACALGTATPGTLWGSAAAAAASGAVWAATTAAGGVVVRPIVAGGWLLGVVVAAVNGLLLTPLLLRVWGPLPGRVLPPPPPLQLPPTAWLREGGGGAAGRGGVEGGDPASRALVSTAPVVSDASWPTAAAGGRNPSPGSNLHLSTFAAAATNSVAGWDGDPSSCGTVAAAMALAMLPPPPSSPPPPPLSRPAHRLVSTGGPPLAAAAVAAMGDSCSGGDSGSGSGNSGNGSGTRGTTATTMPTLCMTVVAGMVASAAAAAPVALLPVTAVNTRRPVAPSAATATAGLMAAGVRAATGGY
ncbi:hypothetical protein MMPV_003360 [Pyropia vietnamensis]